MVDRFVAIPVGAGDALFFQRGEFSALIDGGKSLSSFPRMFQSYLNRSTVNVLVCTHNDADHSCGIIGFLESDCKCEEVWLPALWKDRLDDLTNRSSEFFDELAKDIESSSLPTADDQRRPDRLSLESLGDLYAQEEQDSGPEGEGEVFTGEALPLEAIDSEDKKFDSRLLSYRIEADPFLDLRIIMLRNAIQPDRWMLFYQALAAAHRINAIADAARDRNIPIRWFRYSATSARGGKTGLLVPLNAIEVQPKPRKISSFTYLALTVANRQSLVFASPSRPKWPGVVFSADSNFGFSCQIPWNNEMLVTAPHHGSESNANVYRKFKKEVGGKFDVNWIRSDGKYKDRPGPSYLGLNKKHRYCTICRGSIQPKQAVRFAIQHGGWCPGSTRPCACK